MDILKKETCHIYLSNIRLIDSEISLYPH